jgi:para-nitrobenzyl esterase
VDQIDRVGTGIEYLCPSLGLASTVDDVGGRAWVYRFDRVRPGFEAIGAYHGAELPYMFDQHDAWLPQEDTDQNITRDMVAHWSAFVRGGDPSTVGAPEWPQWRTGVGQMLRYGDQTLTGAHPDAAFCDWLRNHYLSSGDS